MNGKDGRKEGTKECCLVRYKGREADGGDLDKSTEY